MSKGDTIPPEFTTEDVQFLRQGLAALQAVLDLAHQPVPSRLEYLRRQLQLWENMGSENWPQKETMSAREVADLLNVTLQQVCQLGRKKRLDVAKKGRRGRGYSTLYTTESVRRYVKNRPHPGRQSSSCLTKESL